MPFYGRHDSQSWSRLCSRSVEKRKSDHHILKFNNKWLPIKHSKQLLSTRKSVTVDAESHNHSLHVQALHINDDALTVTRTTSLYMETFVLPYKCFFFLSFFLSFILFLGFLKDKQSLVGADCHVPKVVVTSRHCIPQFAVDDGKLQKKAVHRNTKSWGTFTHTAVTVRYTHLPDTVKPQPVFHWSLGRTIKQQQKKNRRAPPSRSRLQSHVYEEALQPVNALVHQ